jgi:hypothetical protein
MTALPEICGFLGAALLAAAAAGLCARRWSLPQPARLAIVLGAAAAMAAPLGELSAAGYLRGALGDLSLVSQALLATAVAEYALGRNVLDRRELGIAMSLVVAAAIFLYPAALGLTYFDPYALGYSSPYLVCALLLLTLGAWTLRLEWLVACLLLAVTARVLNALESRNLWDYLIDPLLVLYAAFWLARFGLRRMRPAFTPSAGRP